MREADVSVGVGGVGIELEDQFGVRQRVLELVVPAVDLDAEFIGSKVFRIEADGGGEIVEGLAHLHFKQDPQTSIIDSVVSSPLPSSLGRPPVGKGGGDGRIST